MKTRAQAGIVQPGGGPPAPQFLGQDYTLFSDYSVIGPAMGVVAVIYLLPSFIGVVRRRPNLQMIFGVNLLLGWSVIGWVVAMMWAMAGYEGKLFEKRSGNRQPCPSCGRSLRKTARQCRRCGYTLAALSDR